MDKKPKDKREWVIICNRHKSDTSGMLFWGFKSKDGEERSFSGYTSDFRECEKYTLDEIKKNYSKIAVYNKVDLLMSMNWREYDDLAIKIPDLNDIGLKKYTIYA